MAELAGNAIGDICFGADRIMKLPDSSLRIYAPAKLNLGLIVYPSRGDGFHDLESWFVPISIYDTLTFHPADILHLHVTGKCGNVTGNLQDNLVGKAAMLLARVMGKTAGAAIHLHKLVPAGGGLGGGSSDAAATLIALNYLWGAHLPSEELEQLAAKLGSDVPFFIRCSSTICRGRGERMTPLKFQNWLYAVLFIPPMGVATKAVYQRFDARRPEAPARLPDWSMLANASADKISATITNDLQAPAYDVEPELKDLSQKLAQITRKPIQMSGSGSTLFALADSPEEAEEIRCKATEKADGRFMVAAARIYRTGEFP